MQSYINLETKLQIKSSMPRTIGDKEKKEKIEAGKDQHSFGNNGLMGWREVGRFYEVEGQAQNNGR